MKEKKTGGKTKATDTEALERLKASERGPEETNDSPPLEGGEKSEPSAPEPTPYGVYQRGKRKGEPREKPYVSQKPEAVVEAPVISRELMLDVVKLPYDWAASQYGEHWALSDKEAERMTGVHVLAAEKYLGEWLKQYPELFAVLMFHTVAIFARVRLTQKLLAEQEHKEPKGEPKKDERGTDLHGSPGLREIHPHEGGPKRVPPGGAV